MNGYIAGTDLEPKWQNLLPELSYSAGSRNDQGTAEDKTSSSVLQLRFKTVYSESGTSGSTPLYQKQRL